LIGMAFNNPQPTTGETRINAKNYHDVRVPSEGKD